MNALSFGYRSSKFLYFGGSGKVVNVWDRQEGKLASVLKGHKSAIQTLSLSTDDQRCASGSSKGDLLIHSLKHGTKSTLVSPLKQGINQVQFYPFKKSILMAGGDEGTLVFWDIHSKLEPTQAKKEIHLGPITGIAFAPCNKHLYCTVGLDKVLRFHDINQSGQSYVPPLNISAIFLELTFCSFRILHSFTAPEALTSVTINEDHSVAVGTSKGSVILYDVRWKGPVFMIPSQSNAAVKSLAFQPPKVSIYKRYTLWNLIKAIRLKTKWAIDASSKEKISVASFVRTHEFSEDAMPDTISKLEISKETTEHKAPSTGHKDRAMMDMFSPVNKNSTT